MACEQLDAAALPFRVVYPDPGPDLRVVYPSPQPRTRRDPWLRRVIRLVGSAWRRHRPAGEGPVVVESAAGVLALTWGAGEVVALVDGRLALVEAGERSLVLDARDGASDAQRRAAVMALLGAMP